MKEGYHFFLSKSWLQQSLSSGQPCQVLMRARDDTSESLPLVQFAQKSSDCRLLYINFDDGSICWQSCKKSRFVIGKNHAPPFYYTTSQAHRPTAMVLPQSSFLGVVGFSPLLCASCRVLSKARRLNRVKEPSPGPGDIKA